MRRGPDDHARLAPCRFWRCDAVGPSTTWLARRLSQRLDHEPQGFTLEVVEVAGALGLGTTEGRHSPIVRALHRACQFGLARAIADDALLIRRNLPPLTRHQVERLPLAVQADHAAWSANELDAGSLEAQTRRARRIALDLAELGEDVPSTAERLHRWHVHPAIAHDAARWAHRVMAAREDGRPSLREVPAAAREDGRPSLREVPAAARGDAA